jgi:hypothetical protein
MSIDVVIPAHRKDAPALPAVIGAALRHIADVRRVVVVSREEVRSADPRVVWQPEPPESELPRPTVLGERSGWVYQQLLKLGTPTYAHDVSDAFLIVDADVVFLRPTSFTPEPGKRFPYSIGYEWHAPYRAAYERLFGRKPPVGYSLISHHMLLDRELLAEMFAEIESIHGVPWHEAYVAAVDPSEPSSIADYETYGWWMLDRHPELAYRRQLEWRDVRVIPGPVGRALYGADFDFVAAHAWGRQPRGRRAAGLAARLAGESLRDLRWRATRTGMKLDEGADHYRPDR